MIMAGTSVYLGEVLVDSLIYLKLYSITKNCTFTLGAIYQNERL